MEWLKELTETAKHDAEYQRCLLEANRLEPAFLTLRDTLTQQQRDTLEAYISACEEMDHRLLLLAWDLARDRAIEDYLDARKRQADRMEDIQAHGPRYQAAEAYMAWAEENQDLAYMAMKEWLLRAAREYDVEQGL